MSGVLEGRTAVVTGGTRGIGRAIALGFLAEGAKVAVSYVSDEDAAERFLTDASAPDRSMAVKADVSSRADVQRLFAEMKERFGDPEILVNNAGITRDGFLMLMREEDWDDVMSVSLKGTFNCSKEACRGMIAQKRGRIINMVSPSAITGRAGQTNYSAAKGGVLSFTRSLARELAKFGITVNALSPGVIKTGLTESLPDKVATELLGLIPLGRFGEAGEVAGAAVFLASDEASYITGQTLPLDGGICI